MRTLLVFASGALGLCAMAIMLAIKEEYAYWAPRLGAVLIRLASLLLPRGRRRSRREEFLAELDVLEASGQHGLLFSLGAAASCVPLAVRDRQLQRRLHLADRRTLDYERMRELVVRWRVANPDHEGRVGVGVDRATGAMRVITDEDRPRDLGPPLGHWRHRVRGRSTPARVVEESAFTRIVSTQSPDERDELLRREIAGLVRRSRPISS